MKLRDLRNGAPSTTPFDDTKGVIPPPLEKEYEGSEYSV